MHSPLGLDEPRILGLLCILILLLGCGGGRRVLSTATRPPILAMAVAVTAVWLLDVLPTADVFAGAVRRMPDDAAASARVAATTEEPAADAAVDAEPKEPEAPKGTGGSFPTVDPLVDPAIPMRASPGRWLGTGGCSRRRGKAPDVHIRLPGQHPHLGHRMRQEDVPCLGPAHPHAPIPAVVSEFVDPSPEVVAPSVPTHQDPPSGHEGTLWHAVGPAAAPGVEDAQGRDAARVDPQRRSQAEGSRAPEDDLPQFRGQGRGAWHAPRVPPHSSVEGIVILTIFFIPCDEGMLSHQFESHASSPHCTSSSLSPCVPNPPRPRAGATSSASPATSSRPSRTSCPTTW